MSLSEIQAVFYRFLAGALKKYSQSAIHEKKLFSLLKSHPFIQNPFFAALDRRFAARQSKNIGETISPFIFKKLFISGLIEKIHAADIVFCNVGGLISDHLEFYLPCYLFECFLAKELGKPVVSMNQTIAVNKALNRKMVAWVYSLLDYHVTREPLSADALIGMGIDKHRVMTSCDSAFAADYTIDESAAAYSTPSPALNHGGIGFAIRGDRGIDHVRTSELLKAVGQRFNAPVFFFTTCKAHDEHVYKKLSKTTELSYLDFNNDYRLLTHFLKNLDMVITDRYHAEFLRCLQPPLSFRSNRRQLSWRGFSDSSNTPLALNPSSICLWGSLLTALNLYIKKNRRFRSFWLPPRAA
jgi:polysaccharide pyruvyl transferase WcaK-like protein